jgi:hypothetical protein
MQVKTDKQAATPDNSAQSDSCPTENPIEMRRKVNR